MTFKPTNTLRPGLLVSLKTSVSGNVKYHKTVVEGDHETESGEHRARWETERVITNAAELEAAKIARGQAYTLIRRVCAQTAFGMLCPEADAESLTEAIAEARRVTEAFNQTSEITRISIYVMTGRVAPDDVEAVRAINSEVADLIKQMQDGVTELDAKAIREAASRAKSLGSMFNPDAQARVTVAVEAGREVAKKIVKAGETGGVEVDPRAVRTLTESRTAFLDLEDAAQVAAPKSTRGRSLDVAAEG